MTFTSVVLFENTGALFIATPPSSASDCLAASRGCGAGVADKQYNVENECRNPVGYFCLVTFWRLCVAIYFTGGITQPNVCERCCSLLVVPLEGFFFCEGTRGGVLLTSSLNFPLWHSASLDVAALLSAGVPLGSFFLISLSVVSLRRNFGPTQARGGAEETRRVDCLFSRTTETDVSVAHLDASRTQWCLKAYEFLKIQAVDWPTCCFEIQAPLWWQAGDLTRFDSLSNK